MAQPFKAIIAYKIQNRSVEKSFIQLIDEIGFIEQENQKVHVFPARRPFDDSIAETLKEFCYNNLGKDDLVDYYWMAYQLGECIGLVLTKYRYKECELF